jgi:hypothetical protein
LDTRATAMCAIKERRVPRNSLKDTNRDACLESGVAAQVSSEKVRNTANIATNYQKRGGQSVKINVAQRLA